MTIQQWNMYVQQSIPTIIWLILIIFLVSLILGIVTNWMTMQKVKLEIGKTGQVGRNQMTRMNNQKAVSKTMDGK